MLKSIFFFLLLALTLNARDINVETMAADAEKSGKYLLVWLHKTDCGYCEAMREFTLDNEKVKAVLKKDFVFEHINVNDGDTVSYKDFKGSGKAFAKMTGYSFYPSSLFFDGDAEMIFAAPGYIEEDSFLVMLDYVRSGAYKKMGYDGFRRREEKN